MHTLLVLGDVVAQAGRDALYRHLPLLKKELSPTCTIVNGENASGGLGITAAQHTEIITSGADCVTLGDHAYHRKEIRNHFPKLPDHPTLIRPANFPAENPGKGWTVITTPAGNVVVVNLMGRTFMAPVLDCPFRYFDALWPTLQQTSKCIVVDFHAEATSEKIAFGRHVDGRASLVVGTHTHVQTADDQILAHGTGYISDLGMCGAHNGVIGLDGDTALKRFLTGMQEPYLPQEGDGALHGVVAEVDAESGRCSRIRRVRNSALVV